jgi:peptide deformylase
MTFKQFLENQDIQIRKFPDPILRTVTTLVEEVTDEVRQVCDKLLTLMYKFKGVGLAAPQVGLPYRIFVADPAPGTERSKPYIFINPQIIFRGERSSLEMEGCLSFPGISSVIERPHKMMFTHLDMNGKHQKQCYEGLLGRICQHEIDHLYGILFIDRMFEADRVRTKPAIDKMIPEAIP